MRLAGAWRGPIVRVITIAPGAELPGEERAHVGERGVGRVRLRRAQYEHRSIREPAEEHRPPERQRAGVVGGEIADGVDSARSNGGAARAKGDRGAGRIEGEYLREPEGIGGYGRGVARAREGRRRNASGRAEARVARDVLRLKARDIGREEVERLRVSAAALEGLDHGAGARVQAPALVETHSAPGRASTNASRSTSSMSSGGVRVRTSPARPPVRAMYPSPSSLLARYPERAPGSPFERDPDHEPAALHGPHPEPLRPQSNPLHPASAHVFRALRQAPCSQSCDRREGRTAAERCPEVRRRMDRRPAMRSPGGHRAPAADARADRDAGAEALAQAHDVRQDPRLDAREPGSAATEPGPDFVAHEQRSGVVARAAEEREKLGGRNHAPAAAQNGLDEDGPEIPIGERCLHGGHRRREGRGPVGVGREADLGAQLRGEGFAEARTEAACGQRRVGQPVVGALERDHAGTPGREHRGLQRGRDGIGAAGAEHHAGPRLGVERNQLLAEKELRV